MSAAKDALLDLHADILCFQEVRDWDSMAELVSVLAGFHPLVVSPSMVPLGVLLTRDQPNSRIGAHKIRLCLGIALLAMGVPTAKSSCPL